ncbi:MAG TPA: Flp pilus assembly protein CpaB [Pyrinomonadaceae bacterium]|jgi:pilus assembly protein CpaB|nr:Flp pilus assembly protein CpaB [Pyrinomonadaceae bacterium]
MRNKRLVFVMCGAVVFGLVAAFSVSRYLSGTQAYAKNLNSVVVAKVNIQPGEKIIAEQLQSVQFPSNAMPDGTFQSADKLIGRVAVVQIAAREPITDYKLAPEGSAGGLSAVIPEGYRAMTVKVDDVVGISGFVMPGALVDVVVVINPAEQNGQENPISKIVLQNIKVLANGQNIDRPENDREPESVKAVTLQVTPEQAEKLALASSEGKLQLVMRNSVDQGDEQTLGVDKRILLGGERAKPVPDAGSLKSEQPPQTQQQQSAPVFRRYPRAADYGRSSSSNNGIPAPQAANPPAAPAAAPAPPRSSIEVIEGAKKRNVDFP